LSVSETGRHRILVVEREPYWLPELQRQFQRSGVEVAPAQTWDEAAGPAGRDGVEGLTVCEFGEVAEGLLNTIAAGSDLQSGRLVVVLDEASRGWEWALREAGVADVVDEFSGGGAVAALCRRLLRLG
jgi:hypothetical protein